MALQQTKVTKIKRNKRTLHKEDLAKELDVSVAVINEYILGDRSMPDNTKITPDKNGMVIIETEERYETPKYDGIFYNELKNGDKTFYIVYRDLKTNKKIDLKIGRESQGYTELKCHNERNKILDEMRTGKSQTRIMNKRVFAKIVTLDAVAEKYHKDRSLYLTKPNLQKSKSLYKRRIQPYIGDKDITTIADSDIKEIMHDLQDELTNRSLNIIVEKISTIFNYAIKEKLYVGTNPTKSIEKLSAKNERIRYLSKEEMQQLMKAVEDNNILYIFTYLALTTGARLTALCSLKVQDIDFAHSIINISDDKSEEYYQAFLKKDENFILRLKEQIKGMSPVDLILGDKTVIGHKRYLQRELSKIFNKLFNKTLIDKEKENDKNFNAELRRNKVVIHSLRHTFASQLAIAGTPIYTIQKLMNHSDIKMTERYAKLSKDSGRNFVDEIF
ncbi:site-specific integrase [bacterium]|nr:site-specific integrase [bacterium]MBU1433432.1 site-specific integrase [bacterium]MBU1503386.1 site-specific integrase [bacterium]